MFFFKLCPIHGKSTHPVDICIALWNDVGVKEGGFTRCGEREEGTRSESRGRKGRSEIRDTSSAFLTCRETHGNNDFCLVGGERGRRRVVKWCSVVNLPLKVCMNRNINTNTEKKQQSLYVHCTHWVKIRQAVGGALPAQEVLLWGVELQSNVQSKLQKQKVPTVSSLGYYQEIITLDL